MGREIQNFPENFKLTIEIKIAHKEWTVENIAQYIELTSQ